MRTSACTVDCHSTDDFSGPAESTTFVLGSLIPIMASVEQHSHQPLLLLLDECIATTTPDLWSDGDAYSIITHKGYAGLKVLRSPRGFWALKMSLKPPRCLVDSKVSRSRFEPRRNSSEIQLSLQAFSFGLGEQVRRLQPGLTFTLSFDSNFLCFAGVYPLHAAGSRSKWDGHHQKSLSLPTAWVRVFTLPLC